MKLLAAIILGGVMTAASWADTVKITIERTNVAGTPSASTSTSYAVEVGQSRIFDGMQMQQISPTSGDCSGVDTSKLIRDVKHGELLRVRTSRMVDGHVLIALKYENRKFLGTKETQYNKICKVNNPGSEATSFDLSASLRKGEPPLLLRGSSEYKVFGVIEP